jgi:predicted nucleic acid-binding protein
VTKYVIDAGAALELVKSGLQVTANDDVEAPTLIRFEALSLLREEVVRGELGVDEAYELYRRLMAMPIRQLGDAVLQRRAWEAAEQFAWPNTFRAEYVAMARLHKRTLITSDRQLARQVEGFVPVVDLDALRRK